MSWENQIDSEVKSRVEIVRKPQDTVCAGGFFASENDLRFRPMTTADMDEIMTIERASYRFPWSMGFFLQELQVACARSILAEAEGKIIGYVLYWILPGVVDIHNIAVHLDFRRRGIGRVLLKKVMGDARRQSISRVTLEVRVSNLVAQKLYESIGFRSTGLRKGYYSDDGEDAIAMNFDLCTD